MIISLSSSTSASSAPVKKVAGLAAADMAWRRRIGRVDRGGDRRGGAELDRVAAAEIVAHRFPFLNSEAR